MLIHRPSLLIGKDGATATATIEIGGLTRRLWFTVPPGLAADVVNERLDGFLLALLIPAMRLGEDITLGGPVSKQPYFSLVNDVEPLLALHVPRARRIEIRAPAQAEALSRRRFEALRPFSE